MLLSVFTTELGTENVNLTTYYPAPSGVYTRMITTGQTVLARDAGANVGIGTAAPATKLDVSNPAIVDTWIRVISGNGSGILIGSCNGGTESCLHQTSATNWTFRRQDGAVQMAINNNGNVGIGTASPGVKLEVNGDIRGARVFNAVYAAP
ncbi:MAG: hypothetical protein A3J74_01745 [Elusimicrobia bacterium RIFCSPHIGHO2_02_FULL_57_9]|nr:MAG: hypothetical protein A3J74_01745 [Elusimicrobia bacterium RIFCSPHIGHO2_02_FULL_57_9]